MLLLFQEVLEEIKILSARVLELEEEIAKLEAHGNSRAMLRKETVEKQKMEKKFIIYYMI